MQDVRGFLDLHRFLMFQGPWPEHLLGPRPTLKQISLVCWLYLAANVILFVAIYENQMRHDTGMFSGFHDFTSLYGDGHISNEYPASMRYDYDIQTKVFNQIVPSPKGSVYWPSPYPPFVAMFFGLIARLPDAVPAVLEVAQREEACAVAGMGNNPYLDFVAEYLCTCLRYGSGYHRDYPDPWSADGLRIESCLRMGHSVVAGNICGILQNYRDYPEVRNSGSYYPALHSRRRGVLFPTPRNSPERGT
jgi:hypothetical protein